MILKYITVSTYSMSALIPIGHAILNDDAIDLACRETLGRN